MHLSAKDSASAMKTFQSPGELHGLWVVCSAEALAAAPAAKDVDTKENETGAIATRHQSEKTRGSGPGAPRPHFFGEKSAPPGNDEF